MAHLPPNAEKLHPELNIWKVKDFVSDDEIRQLLEDAERNGYQRSEVDSKDESMTPSRTSTTSFLNEKSTPTGMKIARRAMRIVGTEALEGIQVQRYDISQKYNPHYDTFEHKDGKDQRSWTVMVYLNDVKKGGGTYFPKVDFRIYPEKGSAVIWNNLTSSGCRDVNTLHMGEPVEDGVKYIVTYWFRKDKEPLCNQAKGVKFNMEHYGEIQESDFPWWGWILLVLGAFVLSVFFVYVILR